MKAALATVVLAISLLAGCSKEPATAGGNSEEAASTFVGTYAVEQRGELKEFIRIEQAEGQTTMSEKQGGRWRSPHVIAPLGTTEFEKLFKDSSPSTAEGMGNKSMAIVRVPKGWGNGKFESKTGVVLFTMLGPVDLHKQ